jgi:hypothetical protein
MHGEMHVLSSCTVRVERRRQAIGLEPRWLAGESRSINAYRPHHPTLHSCSITQLVLVNRHYSVLNLFSLVVSTSHSFSMRAHCGAPVTNLLIWF